jgi:hypothetical protein
MGRPSGKQKYIGNGKQKCSIKGKPKYTIESGQNSYFWETPVGFKKPYRSGNEKTKNVQTDSNIQAARVLQQ